MGKITAQRCEFLRIHAMRERRKHASDFVSLDVISIIEHTLPFKFGWDYFDIVEELRVDGLSVDAYVSIGARTQLSITRQVYDLADRDDGPSRFSLAHEIAHILLHSTTKKQDVARQLARGMPGTGTSFKKDAREEEEANYYANHLLVPNEAIDEYTSPEMIMMRYKVSRSVANRSLHEWRCRAKT